MSKQQISTADTLYYGSASVPEVYSSTGRRGVPVVMVTRVDLGAPVAADDNYLVDAATGTELPDAAAPGETVTYTTTNDGTSPFDNADTPTVATLTLASGSTVSVWPMATPAVLELIVTHATAVVAMTCTVTGYDVYKNRMVETFSATAGTTSKTASGKKAFAYIESIAFTAAADASANTAKLGVTKIQGLPYFLKNKGDLIALTVDGVADAPAALVAGVTTTATATTGDTRGTISPTTAPDGSKKFTAWMAVSDTQSREGVIGVAQYAG